jgi:hypothetical protein
MGRQQWREQKRINVEKFALIAAAILVSGFLGKA